MAGVQRHPTLVTAAVMALAMHSAAAPRLSARRHSPLLSIPHHIDEDDARDRVDRGVRGR